MKNKIRNRKFNVTPLLVLLFVAMTIGCSKEELLNTEGTQLINPISQSRTTVAIQNSGFENSRNNWEFQDPSAISLAKHTGKRSAKITDSGGKFEQEVEVKPQTNYVLSAYILGKGTIGVQVNSKNYTNGGNFSQWKKTNVTFNSGTSSSVTIFGKYNGGTGRFDDFSLEESNGSVDDDKNAQKLSISNASANRDDGNVPSNTIDGKLETRWSAEGDGSYITYDLESVKTISNMKIAWYKGDTRKAYFVIRAGDSKYSLSTVYDGRGNGSSSGTTLQFETYDLGNITARYIRITGFGNSSSNNDWNSITEVELWGDNNGDADTNDDDDTSNSSAPFNIFQNNWKLTASKDDDNDRSADEIFIDASKNDVRSDGSLRYYENNRYFYKVGEWTHFKCQGNGETTGNSSNPRTELRQMKPGGSIQSNWDMTSSTSNTMEMTLKIMQTSESKKLAFAQIHAESGSIWDDILRIQIQSDKPNAKVGDKGHIYIMGSGKKKNHDIILSDYTLGEELNIKIVAKNSQYKIYFDNKEIYTSISNIVSKGNYFKAGTYLQSVKSAGTKGEGIVAFKKILVY